MRPVILLLSAWCLWATQAQAAILFDSDFEGCATMAACGWNADGSAAPNLLPSTERPFTGSQSVKAVWDNPAGSTLRPFADKSVGSYDHLFLRFAHFTNPGWQGSTNFYTKYIRFTGIGGNPNMWVSEHSGGGYNLGVEAPYQGTDNIIKFSGILPSRTSWDQVEVEWLLNTPGQSNGLIRMWVNNILRIEMLNVAFRGPTPTSTCGTPIYSCPSTMKIGVFRIYVQSGLGTQFFDRIAVGTTRIGLVGGGAPPPPPTDSTPPTPPTAVTVQ